MLTFATGQALFEVSTRTPAQRFEVSDHLLVTLLWEIAQTQIRIVFVASNLRLVQTAQ